MADYVKVTIIAEDLATGATQTLVVNKARDLSLDLRPIRGAMEIRELETVPKRPDRGVEMTLTLRGERGDDGVIYTITEAKPGD